MPYKSEKLRIANTIYDRRRKLLDFQKEYIKWLREEENLSYQKIADMFNVSKKCIIFVCNPDKYKKTLCENKERRKDDRYKKDKTYWANIKRGYRYYKQSLYLKGMLK